MIDEIIEIAKEAGKIIREGFGKNLTFEFKTNNSDFVTNIDKKAEAEIINFIKKKFPSHSILAEESGLEKKDSEYTWVVDPLDGTMNFAHGLPIFSVSIGLMKNEEIIAGVIYDVMNDTVYSAEKGSGAFQNGRKISVSKNNDLEKSLLVTGFPYNIKENPNNAVEKFSTFLMNCRGVRRLGSAALDLCYVANGTFDGFWEVTLNAWDMCAGHLLVEEAGGKVTDFNGAQISYKNPYGIELLASNGNVHHRMIELLE